jgi:hypothetical protein
LGDALLVQGKVEEFAILVAAVPDSPEAPIGRAVLEIIREAAEGRGELALAIAEKWLRAHQEDFFLARIKARLLHALSKCPADVERSLEAVLSVDPLDIEARAASRQLAKSSLSPHQGGYSRLFAFG